jgi:hypothetical protein
MRRAPEQFSEPQAGVPWIISSLRHQSGVNFRHRPLTLSFLAVLIVLVAGCATRRADTHPPATNDDIADARLIVSDSLNAVQSMCHALEALGNVSGPCPPEVFVQLTTNTHRLHVDSIKFRAHAQAMRSLGDAYFEEWQLHLAGAKDPEVRKLANDRREILLQSFDKIQRGSQQTREDFKPFFLDVRTLRRVLEREPSANVTDSTKELIRKAKDDGQKVLQDLGGIRRELDSVSVNLTPAKGPA